jgi:hypothetical protein
MNVSFSSCLEKEERTGTPKDVRRDDMRQHHDDPRADAHDAHDASEQPKKNR